MVWKKLRRLFSGGKEQPESEIRPDAEAQVKDTVWEIDIDGMVRRKDFNKLVKSLVDYRNDDHICSLVKETLVKMGAADPKQLLKAIIDLKYLTMALPCEVVELIGAPIVEPLIGLLANANNEVTQFAVYRLSKIKDPRAIAPLVQLMNDSRSYLSLSAASALGTIGDPQAMKPLLAALEVDDPTLNEYALKSLKALGYKPETQKQRAFVAILEQRFTDVLQEGEVAEELLLRHFRTADRLARVKIAAALGELGSQKARLALREVCRNEEENYDVQRAAILALGKMTTADSAQRSPAPGFGPAASAPGPSDRAPQWTPPADETLQPGEFMTQVTSTTQLLPGVVIRIWHDHLKQWTPGGWSEVMVVEGDMICLRNIMADTFEARSVKDTARSAWLHPRPDRLLSLGTEKQAAQKARKLTTSRSYNLKKAPGKAERLAGRAGKCNKCGTVVELANAVQPVWDWDGVDAHYYYCPECYLPGDSNINHGRLLGDDNKPLIDQIIRL